MPYISEKLKVGKENDRRLKLNDFQRLSIIRLYKEGGTFRGLAREFKVDRRTIKNIVFPDFYKKQLEKYKLDKHWKKYYNCEKSTKAHRDYSRYKYSLYKKGVLKIKDRTYCPIKQQGL